MSGHLVVIWGEGILSFSACSPRDLFPIVGFREVGWENAWYLGAQDLRCHIVISVPSR